MLKIKLARIGKKNERHYRIVVAEEHSKLTGANTAVVGHFHPMLDKDATGRLVADMEQVKQWMVKGAQPTAIVKKLLKI